MTRIASVILPLPLPEAFDYAEPDGMGLQVGDLVEVFARTFFRMGGVQINLNVIAMATLKEAMAHPEEQRYQDIVVKVTGYSSHFLILDRRFQEEFIQRVNYPAM